MQHHLALMYERAGEHVRIIAAVLQQSIYSAVRWVNLYSIVANWSSKLGQHVSYLAGSSGRFTNRDFSATLDK